MSIIDKATGRAKEALGDLTDDPSLKREGTKEERKGERKEELAETQREEEQKKDEVANLERQT